METPTTSTPDVPGKTKELSWRDLMPHLVKDHTQLIIEFQLLEDGSPVTARGACTVMSGAGDSAVLGAFTPKTITRLLRAGIDVTIRLTREGQTYQTRTKLQKTGTDEVTIAMPGLLNAESRRYLRITPNAADPVQVFVLMPDLPTARLTAVEVSQRGLSFYSGQGLEKGSSSAFTIILPDPPAVILSAGTIRYKRSHEGGFFYGVELHIHSRDEEYLARYIMQREREIRELL